MNKLGEKTDFSLVVDALRRQIAGIAPGSAGAGGGAGGAGGGGVGGAKGSVASLGAALDKALPWGGLPYGGLHEVAHPPGDGAGLGFAAGLLGCVLGAKDARAKNSGLWCASARARQESGVAYGPGLAALGLDPGAWLFVEARSGAEVLWAMEQGLQCQSVAAVLGEVAEVAPISGRRLALAAAANGVACILLQSTARPPAASAAMTRWRVQAAPDAPDAERRFDVELWRCRAGSPKAWRLQWDRDALCFRVVAPLVGGMREGARSA